MRPGLTCNDSNRKQTQIFISSIVFETTKKRSKIFQLKIFCLSGVPLNPVQMAHFLSNVDEELATWLKNMHRAVQPLQVFLSAKGL